MHTGELHDYALLRVVPRVERKEFLDVGLLLASTSGRTLLARVELDCARLLLSVRAWTLDSSSASWAPSSRSAKAARRAGG